MTDARILTDPDSYSMRLAQLPWIPQQPWELLQALTRDADAEVAALRARLAEVERDLNSARRATTKLQTQLDELDGARSSLLDDIAQMREERQADHKAMAWQREEICKLRTAHADADQAEARLAQMRDALMGLANAIGDVWRDVENCEDCAAVDAFDDHGGSACQVHTSQPLWTAMMAAWEVLGPCPCGHPHSQHYDEDSTACRMCGCQRFRLPLFASDAPTPTGEQ